MTIEVTYPDVTVQLTDRDGNAFAIIGAVSSRLRREVGATESSAFAEEAMQAESYDELLQFVMRTVNVE